MQTEPPKPRTPIARATDPETSHAAGESLTRSGERDRQAAIVLAAVRQYPGRTSAELAGLCGLDRYQTARRCPELRDLGEVTDGEARACQVTGRKAMTWWPVVPTTQPSLF